MVTSSAIPPLDNTDPTVAVASHLDDQQSTITGSISQSYANAQNYASAAIQSAQAMQNVIKGLVSSADSTIGSINIPNVSFNTDTFQYPGEYPRPLPLYDTQWPTEPKLNNVVDYVPPTPPIESSVVANYFTTLFTPEPKLSAVEAFHLPAAPTAPNEAVAFPTLPTPVTVASVNSALALTAQPAFSAADPNITDVTAPNPFAGTFPNVPALGIIPELPNAPVINFPSVPTMRGIGLPNDPVLTLPLFTATAPLSPDAPDVQMNWSETPFTSDLLIGMNARLLEFIAGASTGLTPSVENGIWNRARDRASVEARRRKDAATREFSSRGFELPDGVIAERLDEAEQYALNLNNEASRDIMIKQAELEQANFRFAFEQSVNLESKLMDYSGQMQNRALDAMKVQSSLVIQVFNARVSLFNAQAQAYGIEAQVYREQIAAQSILLDQYKAQLEGARLIGTLNMQDVQLYSEQLKGLETMVNVYRSQLEGVKTVLEADRIQLEMYRTEVDAVHVQAQVKALDYQAYDTQVKAQLTKAQVYDSLVGAYSSKVQAWKSFADVQVQSKELEIKAEVEMPLAIIKQQIEAFQSQVQSETARIASIVSLYESNVHSYAATIEGAEAAVRSDVSIQKLALDAHAAESARLSALSDAAKTVTQVYSAEVAGETSRVNTSLSANKLQADVYATQVEALAKIEQTIADVYGSQVTSYTGLMNAELNVISNQTARARLDLDGAIADVNAQVDIAKTTVSKLQVEAGALSEVAKATVQAHSQLAASALSTVNQSLSLGASVSMNSGSSNSLSKALSYSYANSMSTADTTNKSTSDSTSTSDSRSTSDSTSRVDSTSNNTSTSTNTNING